MSQQTNTKMKSKSIFSSLLVVIAIGVYLLFPSEEAADEESPTGLIPVELVKTIDGDTIKVKYEGKEQNLRYLLVDTPETNHA